MGGEVLTVLTVFGRLHDFRAEDCRRLGIRFRIDAHAIRNGCPCKGEISLGKM